MSDNAQNPGEPRIFIVTGSNRGIGRAVVSGIAKRVENAVVYLTSRNIEAGEEALNQMKLDLGSELKADVRTTTLDISDQKSVQDLAALLQASHGGVDVLVNNAGIAFNDELDELEDAEATEDACARRRVEQVESVLDINYYGTKRVCEALIPIMRPGGRIVNITGKYKSELTASLLSPKVTVEDIDKFVEDYKKLIRAESSTDNTLGYTLTAYRISKAAELALTKTQARDLKKNGIRVNACCPGYVATRMSDFEGTLTNEQGADTPIYLAVDPDAPDGKFVFERKTIAW